MKNTELNPSNINMVMNLQHASSRLTDINPANKTSQEVVALPEQQKVVFSPKIKIERNKQLIKAQMFNFPEEQITRPSTTDYNAKRRGMQFNKPIRVVDKFRQSAFCEVTGHKIPIN